MKRRRIPTDQIIDCLREAGEYIPVHWVTARPRKLARLLWRLAARKRRQATRIALKTAAVRLLALADGRTPLPEPTEFPRLMIEPPDDPAEGGEA